MTNPDSTPPPRSPSGFISAERAQALRRMEPIREAAAQALPVRLYHPLEDADAGVIAHFSYTPAGEGWSVFGDVTRGPRGLVISRLQITPESDSSGVTGSLLRKIPVGEVLAAVRLNAAWETAAKEATRLVLGQEPAHGLFGEGDDKAPRRGGRAPITPDLLREVATIYLEETAPGRPAGAMKRMAERFGRPEETLRTWVTRARKDGWLGPSAKGRAGAEPGPRLVLYRIEAEGPGGNLNQAGEK
ncbi:hypothetical protein [Streptomyces mirabilis]|uniref:Helix-turn-helix domain-containing protein n=1 Tax=Streptomyces mirabilis TaxID=68239 RepID=A0ABU3UWB0_9ACTN|nr:hypothetical protein [Streptomyces mirabilis]MDU8998192.1 hypothetical protein [Streptomyces mirabilis]